MNYHTTECSGHSQHGLNAFPFALNLPSQSLTNPHICLPCHSQGLQDVVFDSERTLMVLDEAGAILSRIWCLYEAWKTSLKGGTNS